MRKILIGVITTIFLFSSFSVFSEEEKETKDKLYKELDLLGEAFLIIKEKYVEEKSIKDLIYGAIAGMAHSLDSYSQFLKPEDYKELLVETEGEFGGLGIQITIKDGLLTIVSPLEDTPAYRAGLEPGDVIVKINGELTKGITLQEAVKKLRGKPGTKVTITVLKDKTKELKDITIVRDIIKIKDIKRALVLENNVGYIKLSEFRENTAKELDKALEKLKKEKIKGLILDLRNNPGGLLISAVEVASRFLPTGKLIVSTKSRHGESLNYKSLPCKVKILDIPMVVLINKGSASGSEIVAAALRENKRAVLLGEKSFGKASVQSVIPLPDGSALRITTAKYYTPSGKSIHQKGVEPDILVPSKKVEAEEDVFERIKKEKEGFDYRKDYQILRALDLLKGLIILSS